MLQLQELLLLLLTLPPLLQGLLLLLLLSLLVLFHLLLPLVLLLPRDPPDLTETVCAPPSTALASTPIPTVALPATVLRPFWLASAPYNINI